MSVMRLLNSWSSSIDRERRRPYRIVVRGFWNFSHRAGSRNPRGMNRMMLIMYWGKLMNISPAGIRFTNGLNEIYCSPGTLVATRIKTRTKQSMYTPTM